MSSRLNPYLTFDGNAREAMEFYHDVLGGDLHMNTFGEFGMEGDGADNIMHAMLESEAGYALMASDVPPGSDFKPGNTVTISLSGDDDKLRGYFERLSDGGTVTQPLEMQMWGDEYGSCNDKFGVAWMVNIAGPDNR